MIENQLVSFVGETPMPMSEVMSHYKDLDEAKLLDSIRFLLDNGVLQMDQQGQLQQRGNKKSRQQ